MNNGDYYFPDKFITDNFDEPVLYAPARTDQSSPCTSMKIITAFTDCDRISTHMINLSDGMKRNDFTKNISVEIILGMTKTSLNAKKHTDICRLIRYINFSSNMPRLSCRYICNGAEVHSKVYIWGFTQNNLYLPTKAYCGSLNYTMNAFYKRRESICECYGLDALKYYDSLIPDTIDCLDPEANERLKNVVNNPSTALDDLEAPEKGYDYYNKTKPIDYLNISLLRSDGSDTGYGSGVNWGIRKNGTKRDANQAYIPYNKADRKEGFFPDRLSPADESCPIFKVITKNFGSFYMRMAQQGNKALHSAESNAIIGEWLRATMGVPMGSYITKQMLETYGKTYVTFRKYEDGTYLLDF